MVEQQGSICRMKVNLPNTIEGYRLGNGEGCWVVVSQETSNLTKGMGNGILDNNSVYYPSLKAGTRIIFEMRGDNRPVVPYELLQQYRPEGFDFLEGFDGNIPLQVTRKRFELLLNTLSVETSDETIRVMLNHITDTIKYNLYEEANHYMDILEKKLKKIR